MRLEDTLLLMDTQWQEYGPEEQKSTNIKPSQETYIPSSFFNQKEKKGCQIAQLDLLV